ncbi:MAG: hypothetical protein JXR91_07670, partial [Deltaproteobacteria bacterium]|nr:hypothetical protein [Deltaproteobacteria bacterium]
MTKKNLTLYIFKTLTTALVLIMFAGCSTVGGNRRKDKNRSVIKDISFKGNKLFSSRELKSYLLIKEKDVIDEQSVGSAFEIIIELYKSKGFFLAEIKRIDIKKDRKKRLKITVVIDENTPAVVTKIHFTWNTEIKNYKNIEKLIDIKVGKPAAAEKLNSSVDTLYEELYNQAYPLAVVNEEIIVKKDFKSAEAFFNIDPGPQSNIGKLTISGLEQIKYKPVYREIEDFEGKPFNAKNKKVIRQALSDMNLFTSVSIVTKKAVDKNNNLDAAIYVTEADTKNLRLGIGLKFEPDKFLVWTSAVYSDSNLFKKLNHFQLTAMA